MYSGKLELFKTAFKALLSNCKFTVVFQMEALNDDLKY